MTAALEGSEWSAARPSRTLPPRKTRYPLHRRLGGSQGRSGWAEYLVPTGIRSRIVQPLVSRYTDWATRPTLWNSTYSQEQEASFYEILSINFRFLEDDQFLCNLFFDITQKIIFNRMLILSSVTKTCLMHKSHSVDWRIYSDGKLKQM